MQETLDLGAIVGCREPVILQPSSTNESDPNMSNNSLVTVFIHHTHNYTRTSCYTLRIFQQSRHIRAVCVGESPYYKQTQNKNLSKKQCHVYSKLSSEWMHSSADVGMTWIIHSGKISNMHIWRPCDWRVLSYLRDERRDLYKHSCY